MNWGERVVAALSRTLIGSEVVLEEEGLRVRCRRDAGDRVGCIIRTLCIQDLRVSERDADELRAWADRIVRRVTYLMERVAPVEVDAASRSVLLRSASPDRRRETRAYYEIVLKSPGTLTLTRYRYQKGDRGRTEIPCLLTLEVFERLVGDLVETMRPAVAVAKEAGAE